MASDIQNAKLLAAYIRGEYYPFISQRFCTTGWPKCRCATCTSRYRRETDMKE